MTSGFARASGGRSARVSEIRSIEVRALAPDVERFRYTAFQDEVFTTTTLVRIEDQDELFVRQGQCLIDLPGLCSRKVH